MPNLVIDILWAATDILTLVIGISGLLLSILLLFKPEVVRRVGTRLNVSFTLIRLPSFLDRWVETSRIAYRHPVLIGSFFIIGSSFLLNFLFFQINPLMFISVPGCVGIECLIWVGKAAALCGILLGAALILAPERVRSLEDRLGGWLDTHRLFRSLDRSFPYVDHIFLRYPLASGAICLLASFMLTMLSVYNLKY